MENTFNSYAVMQRVHDDPMGMDAHRGLERWLDTFHQPGVPSHTIITDPEYFVFLWFHDANGNLIHCPYIPYPNDKESYERRLKETSVDFKTVNTPFNKRQGISGSENNDLPEYCVDLTPFVREINLPEIEPAGAEQIETLFGNTTAGSFSPYASDGQRPITLQVIDTEYSILDAIFYPWMMDINSPWWYRPNDVYTKWATPYPMATLEVQRPRMRYRKNPKAEESRADADYIYYSYKYVGVKPTNYAAFQPNAAGVSSLNRTLTMICDMCIVDFMGQVSGSSGDSVNMGGNRDRSVFKDLESASEIGQDKDSDNGSSDQDEKTKKAKDELDQDKKDLEKASDDVKDNEKDIKNQAAGDMPGEDEAEKPTGNDPQDGDTGHDYTHSDDEKPEDSHMPVDDDSRERPGTDVDPSTELGEETEAPGSGGEPGGGNEGQESLFEPPHLDNPNKDKDDADRSNTEPEPNENEKELVEKVKKELKSVPNDYQNAKGEADKDNGKAEGVSKEVYGELNGNTGQDAGMDAAAINGEKSVTPSEADLVATAKHEEQVGSNTVLDWLRAINYTDNYAYPGISTSQGDSSGSQSQKGNGMAKRSLASRDDNDEYSFLKIYSRQMNEGFSSEVTAFGIVMDVPSEKPWLVKGNTVVYGGYLPNALNLVFPSTIDVIYAGGYAISGVLTYQTAIDNIGQVQMDGVIDQMTYWIQKIQEMRETNDQLGRAFAGIHVNMPWIENLMLNVLSSDGSFGQYGKLFSRMANGRGNLPSPIQNYVDCVSERYDQTIQTTMR